MKYNSKTLDELCNVRIGRTPPRNQSEWFNSGASDDWKWVSIKDMGNCGKFITATSETITDKAKKTFNYATVTSGTILLSFKLTLGRVVICDGEFVTNEAIAQLPIKDPSTIDRDYLYYYLKNYNWSNIGSTSSIATAVNSKMVKSIKIVFPDLETQKKIVRVLSALDQKIELNHKQNQNLSDIIKTLFKNTLNGIGDTVKLGEISKVFSGKRPDSLNEMGKYEVVGARNVMGYTNAYNQEAETIITGRVGTLGIIKRYPRKTWASDNTLVIDTEFKNCIECFLSGIDFNSYNRGSTQPLITQTDLKNLIIPFEKEKFLMAEQKMTPLRNKIFNNELENEQLALLRDTLLPKLLSGSISLESMQL